jgi:hypothetical protein
MRLRAQRRGGAKVKGLGPQSDRRKKPQEKKAQPLSGTSRPESATGTCVIRWTRRVSAGRHMAGWHRAAAGDGCAPRGGWPQRGMAGGGAQRPPFAAGVPAPVHPGVAYGENWNGGRATDTVMLSMWQVRQGCEQGSESPSPPGNSRTHTLPHLGFACRKPHTAVPQLPLPACTQRGRVATAHRAGPRLPMRAGAGGGAAVCGGGCVLAAGVGASCTVAMAAPP